MSVEDCHCGRPLHYSDPGAFRAVQNLVDAQGRCTKVTVGRDTWLVPRHFIALHGLNAAEISTMGFERVRDD